jgi:hypothetical protein
MNFIPRFTKSLSSGAIGETEWHDFVDGYRKHYDDFSLAMKRFMPEEEVAEFLALMLVPVIRNGFFVWRHSRTHCSIGQRNLARTFCQFTTTAQFPTRHP